MDTILLVSFVGFALAVTSSIARAPEVALAVIGIVRQPDANVKIDATALAAMLGLPLVLGATLFSNQVDPILRALLIGVFSGLTSPIGTRELARLERGRAPDGRGPDSPRGEPVRSASAGSGDEAGSGDGARVGASER